jgi:curved DNA-binding protein CbpA
MKNPFFVLQVADTASDEAVQKAYLGAIRRYPPDRAPERFQEIRTAFETIRTHRDRLKYHLFHNEPPEVESLLATCVGAGGARRPTEKQLCQALDWSLRARPHGTDKTTAER